MSEESSHPEPVNKPATTIWDNYSRIKFVCEVFAIFVSPIWIFVIGFSSPYNPIPVNVLGLMMVFHSFVFIAVCAEAFGHGKLALCMILVLDAVWLLSVTCFFCLLFVLYYPGDFGVRFVILAMMILMMSAASFFITYLLWRTNRVG